MTLAQPLDKLGAVNLMLAGSGEQKVNTLVDDGINDTDLAQQILDETIIEVLSDGWTFNQVVKEFQFTTDGFIQISPNYLRVDGAKQDWGRQFTVRDKKLYDLDEDTNIFTENVCLLVTQNLAFEDIPSPFRFYIARAAARIYQAQSRGDVDQDQILRAEELRAWERCKRHDSKTGDHSWIKGTRSTQRHALSRRTPYGPGHLRRL